MTHRSAQEMLLVVHDERLRKLVAEALHGAGYAVTCAGTGTEALARMASAAPELVAVEVAAPMREGLELLRRLRAEPATCELPVIALVAEDSGEGVVASLQSGADDGVSLPLDTADLLARVRARLERPPVPRELLPRDPQTGLLSERRFFEEVARELARAKPRRAPGCLACLELEEASGRGKGGARIQAEIARQVAALLPAGAGALEVTGRDAEGRILLLLPRESASAARRRLVQLCRQITDHHFAVGGEPVRLTPVVGFAPLSRRTQGESEPAGTRERRQALAALDAARRLLAAHPVQYRPALAARARTPVPSSHPGRMARTPLQALLTFLAAPVLPLLHSVAWGRRD